MPNHQALRTLTAEHFRWAVWETLIEENGITLDRPHGTAHPNFPEIIYPMDYGFVRGTCASDGHGVDVFVGTAESALVGLMLCADNRRGDREVKLLYGCTPREVYLAHGFINFDRSLLEGVLALRHPMRALWNAE